MDLELEGKVALVAGSSRGIGLAIAKALLSEGAKVVITGREAGQLEAARMSLATLFPNLAAVQGDLTDPIVIKRALEATETNFGRLDCVVANLGNGSQKGGWDLDSSDWSEALEVNLLGSMRLARAALPRLIAGRGSLTFVSSIAALEAIGAPISYSAGKAAVHAAMKGLSRLVGHSGVRVNCVAPGNIIFPDGAWAKKQAEQPDMVDEYVLSEVPLRRFGQPKEIADAVAFLSSARASFITGACLVVDGGQTRSFA